MAGKPSIEEFVDAWWAKHGEKFANNVMAQNGQLDELPYVEYYELYGESE